jgi:feruloyl esterase
MRIHRNSTRASTATALLTGAMALLAAAQLHAGAAAGFAKLAVVKPILSCADLVTTDLRGVADTAATVRSATLLQTARGQFCRVIAQVEPSIVIAINLPVDHWTQRYIQSGGGGGAPGPDGYGLAGGCMPALDGEFAVGGNNMPTQEMTGPPQPAAPKLATSIGDWGADPQKRIDYGYRASHVTVRVARALMQAYYGRAPRFSYFMGCSDGGREGLIEAQRYPEDFNAVAAGAPAMVVTAQQSTFHLWIAAANRRADGTNILLPSKRALLHDAVLAACDTLSGVKDGLLQDPAGCGFEPATLRCAASAADTTRCLTAEEVSAVEKLYRGAADAQGQPLLFGLERGGELQWSLPDTATAVPEGMRAAALSLAYVILPEPTPSAVDYSHMVFSKTGFELSSTLAPLYNATNTDLKAFAAHGGKLILWHGLSDFWVSPRVSATYYRGVQEFMGAKAASQFMRLFLLPGVGHCSGGDGYDQLDILSPLMAWAELGRAPAWIMAGKTDGIGATNPRAAPEPAKMPLALPLPALSATRPVYPYPFVARYTGRGDPRDGANYEAVKSPHEPGPQIPYAALALFQPDNQREYAVKDGRLAVLNPH